MKLTVNSEPNCQKVLCLLSPFDPIDGKIRNQFGLELALVELTHLGTSCANPHLSIINH